MKITKLTLLLISLLFIQYGQAQQCDYNYDVGSLVMWEINIKQTQEQKQNAEKNLLKLQSCIGKTSNNLELGFLYHRLAQQQFLINILDDRVIENAVKSFESYPEEICQEYITLHLYHEEDPNFIMQKHFLDVLSDERLTSIRSHCIDNYKQLAIDTRNELIALRSAEMKNPTIIQGYADRLRKIEKNDQKERGNPNIDWNVQDRLDEMNRNRLDDLYEKYGFPSIELVGTELASSAFMVLHHSTDCEWNKKWLPRFVEYNQVMDMAKFYLSFSTVTLMKKMEYVKINKFLLTLYYP